MGALFIIIEKNARWDVVFLGHEGHNVNRQTMTFKIGFIGTGKMASAIIKGTVAKGVFRKDEIIASNIHETSRERARKELGIEVTGSSAEVAEKADVIVLAVKPQQIPDVFADKSIKMGKNHLLISIAAGTTIETLKMHVPDSRIIRVMPNICSTNFVGASGFSVGEGCTAEDVRIVEEIFGAVGLCFEVKEKDIDAVSGLSGSGPAFVFMVIDAMADAGVLMGLPRDLSLKLAAQTVMGSAVTVLESGEHPDVLKDKVCSPGGTTIEGVKVLEDYGIRAAFISAVQASVEKARELGRKG